MSAPLSQMDVQEMIDASVGTYRGLISQLQGVMKNAKMASSSATQGPGAAGADVVYSAMELELGAGTWAVVGLATMLSFTAADGKQLALYDAVAGIEIPETRGPALDAPATGVSQAFLTVSVITLAVDARVRLLGVRNGGSQIKFGYTGALAETQRLIALQLSP